MVRRVILFALLFAPSQVRGHDGPDAEQLAGQTLVIIDVIAEHYIAAPPRQEIVRGMIAALRRTGKLDPPLGFGPRLSVMTEDAEFRELLTEQWRYVLTSMQETPSDAVSETLLAQAVSSVLRVAPGRNTLSQVNEHAVEQQLAANRYVGTGIVLAGARDEQPPVMQKVFPDGPADRAGALDGDLIREIDGVTTENMPMVEVVRLLRGPADSQVEVLLQQNEDEPRRYTITRGVVPIQHTHYERKTHEGKTIDVIRFDRLTSATVSDLRKIEREMQSVPDAILLDLQLGESDLHQANLLADALLDGKAIGRLQTARDSRQFTAGRDALFDGVPMFVLVGAQTSGTTEWIAAALQDSGRATIIGRQTAGQPFVSEPFDIPGSDWVLTLSTGVLQRADGGRLLRSTSNGFDARQVPAVVVDRHTGDRLNQPIPRVHDGGVVPDHADPVTQAQAQSGQLQSPQWYAPVPITEALKVVQQLSESQT